MVVPSRMSPMRAYAAHAYAVSGEGLVASRGEKSMARCPHEGCDIVPQRLRRFARGARDARRFLAISCFMR